jgi:hypothetical protein
MSEGGELRGHCPQCNASRNAAVIATHKEEETSNDVWGSSEFSILKCLGCGTVYFRTYSLCSENFNYEEDGETTLTPEIEFWPVPLKLRISIYQLFSLPEGINRLLGEVHQAINNKLHSLAAMGIRSVLEQIIIDRVGDQGTFIKNVDEFQRAGYLSVRQRNQLESLLEAGHAATHRGWQPDDDDISVLWDITDHVIDSVYVHNERASRLEKKLPIRQRPKRDRA